MSVPISNMIVATPQQQRCCCGHCTKSVLVAPLLPHSHVAYRPKDAAKPLGKAEPDPAKGKSSHTRTSNGKQSCLFHCAHKASTEAILKVWKSSKPIPHKTGPKVGDDFVAMSSVLNK